jgi:hypothetical protein
MKHEEDRIVIRTARDSTLVNALQRRSLEGERKSCPLWYVIFRQSP